MELIHIVTAEEAGLTLQQLLRGPMALSGRQTRNAKAQGAVTVDAAPFFSNQKVREGMIVRVVLDGYEPPKATPDVRSPLEIIYEDEALLAVFKPALLQCHPSPSAPGGSDTLEGRVHAYLGYGAHPVHRLDSETTGIVLFAKLPYAQAHLQQQMRSGSFSKVYEAWVLGCPEPGEGEIDAPIAREHPDSFTRIVSQDGQRAVSRYKALKRISLPDGQMVTHMRLSPVTGRTHQLRVHMTHIGCPLLGDTRYRTDASEAVSRALGLTYHQLSAVSLSFVHPITGMRMELTHPAVFAFDPESAILSR
ncbi:MAG: RluA family pseudouridine synthase [Clostridiales bacterium]|nr:RluA family pseudouridine synthase [Clostridiales bacterium]